MGVRRGRAAPAHPQLHERRQPRAPSRVGKWRRVVAATPACACQRAPGPRADVGLYGTWLVPSGAHAKCRLHKSRPRTHPARI